MMPREKWTDERLDDLNKKVDEGFARVESDVRGLRTEMDARFDKVDARFESLNRTLISCAVVIIAALIGLHGV